jgi:hypothetical protein
MSSLLYKQQLFETVFGRFRDFELICIGDEHPDFQNPPKIHPDNLETLKGLSKIFPKEKEYTKDKISNKNFDLTKLTGNILSIGSAKSTRATKILEGYKGNNRFLARDPSLYLRWELLVDEKNIKEISIRYLNSKKWIMPNYSFKDNVKYNECKPEIDGDKWLLHDMLLVSKLSYDLFNCINKNNYAIIVEGSHGTGTKAFNLLINDIVLMSELKNETYAKESWQAFYSVNVKHDHKMKISYPVNLKKADDDYIALI